MGVRSRVRRLTTARVGVISVFDLTFLGYVHYYCHTCGDGCINRRSLSCARHREYKSCYAVPVLDRGEPVDNLLPDLSWAASALRGGLKLPPQAAERPPHTGARSRARRRPEGGGKREAVRNGATAVNAQPSTSD